MVSDLLIQSLRRKLELVSKDLARGGLPVCSPGGDACNPLPSDISVHLDAVRITVVGFDRNPKIRKGKRLIHKIRRLPQRHVLAEELSGRT